MKTTYFKLFLFYTNELMIYTIFFKSVLMSVLFILQIVTRCFSHKQITKTEPIVANPNDLHPN